MKHSLVTHSDALMLHYFLSCDSYGGVGNVVQFHDRIIVDIMGVGFRGC